MSFTKELTARLVDLGDITTDSPGASFLLGASRPGLPVQFELCGLTIADCRGLGPLFGEHVKITIKVERQG